MGGFLRSLGLERFRVNKLKPHLKMAENRLSILNSKKTNLIKTQKRDIAALLRDGKEEKARIRVEHLIRLDFTIEAYELVGLLCELLHERCALVASEKECPPDMREALCTLIWASRRCEVPELKEVAVQLELKYGEEFAEAARTNACECVNARVVHKLGVAPPSAHLVVEYLKAIAAEHGVDWAEPDLGVAPGDLAAMAMPGPSGFSVPVAPGSNLAGAYGAAAPPAAPPPLVVSQPPQATVVAVLEPDADPAVPRVGADAFDDAAAKQGGGDETSTAPHHLDIPPAVGYEDAPAPPPAPPPPPPPPPPPADDDLHARIPHVGPADDAATDYDELQKRFETLRK